MSDGDDGLAASSSSRWILKKVWSICLIAVIGTSFAFLGLFLLLEDSKMVMCAAEYADPPADCGPSCRQTLVIGVEHCRGRLESRTLLRTETKPATLAETLTHMSPHDGGRRMSKSMEDAWRRANGTVRVSGAVESMDIVVEQGQFIRGPVHLYYHLDGFDQAMPLFDVSRSTPQLYGEVVTNYNLLENCEPALYAADKYKVLVPCGVAARSVFNDTFTPVISCVHAPYPCREIIPMRESAEDILWPNAKTYLYKNPSGKGTELLDEWLPEDIFPGRLENPHFHVWMKAAPFPGFHKLYGIIDQDVELPLSIRIVNRYPINAVDGKKSILLVQQSEFGTRSFFPGIYNLFIGVLLIGCGVLSAGWKAVKRHRSSASRAGGGGGG